MIERPPHPWPGAYDIITPFAYRGDNSYIFRVFYGGNPTNYKSYAWGLNDSCPWSFERSKNLYEAWFDWSFQNPRRRDYDIKDLDSAARELLSKSVVNTYAETAPGIDFEKTYSEQIGVDRILIRTVPGG
jgi:hypothetical protein